jgi:AAA domain, putative AbiEii toxin, Type IV TA system
MNSTGEDTGADKPICLWTVPGMMAQPSHMIPARAGRITAVVGANGAGKSALGYWLQQNVAGAPVKRLIAHRRLWFEHAGPNITSADRVSTKQNMAAWSNQPDSRWLDHANPQRAGVVLFDLLAKVNERNARLAALHDGGASSEEVEREVEPSLLVRVNRILSQAHLDVELVLTEQATFDTVSAERGARYPISQMSDGEKSALLLAAEVIAGPERSVQIVDEPERHLHRAISAGLIEAIAAERPDCHFVILTHDLDLAASLPKSTTQLAVLSGCEWSGDRPVGWDLHLVDEDTRLPESARRAILGGRRKILFLEGEPHSLDLHLYALLFPGWTLMPTGGCGQVIRAVGGLVASGAHHWIEPRGIVDGDGRSAGEKFLLNSKGILALPVHEVESLYYSDPVLRALADQQGEMLERAPTDLYDTALARALDAIDTEGTPERLAAAVAEAIVRRTGVDGLPDRHDLINGVDPIRISFSSPYPEQLSRLRTFLGARDLDSVVRLYPVRDTAMRGEVAKALGFRSHADFEAAARTSIRRDKSLSKALLELVGDLPDIPDDTVEKSTAMSLSDGT